MEPGPTLAQRIAEKEKKKTESSSTPEPEINWQDFESVEEKFDKADHLIDLHGHIIGMALSPDHRFVF